MLLNPLKTAYFMTYNDIMTSSYYLTDEELEMCANKTLEEINAEVVKMNKYESLVRQMMKDRFSRLLSSTSEDNPLLVNISIDVKDSFGLSSLNLPRLTEMWQHPSEGWITFVIDDVETDFDIMYTDDLIYILNQLENS